MTNLQAIIGGVVWSFIAIVLAAGALEPVTLTTTAPPAAQAPIA